MLPTLQVGPLAVQTPGLIILVGVWLGLNLAERWAVRHGLRGEQVYNLTFTMLIAGLMGARLAYVVRFPAAFASSPLGLLSPNPSLLDPVGGAAVAVIAGLIYGQRKEMPFWETLDALTPTLAVIGVAIPLANLASGASFGMPSEVGWTIDLWGAKRHPTQIYEAMAGGLILWWVWSRGDGTKLAAGVRFLQWAALSAGARLFLEGFRGDSVVIFNSLRVAQVTAWVALALVLWGLYHRRFAKSG